MMKTEIRTFCDELAHKLAPFATELTQAIEALPEAESDALLSRWRERLREARHRAESLGDKIAQQHAHLLIFGPLKSGKSTLMNAISCAYISEVSSLPAYPALVYARHGDERSFQATTYAGERIDFPDSKAMAEAVAQAHDELGAKILEVERTGEAFDPHRHFANAIRRMDVQVPAEALAQSGSALVDTPGLYTRMRFGYDVMTKDFRDNASCAIFVVKSDNLFFEKVFEEFNTLLGHFSRIFLVVNIDSSKRDLSPDGSLIPSLESRNPGAIVEAFQSLAMSAPLREAYEKGSLNVYPIDLLEAASRRLKQAAGREVETESDDGFDRFVNDLAEYLNSSDYLREFVLDSLRVGISLQSEIASMASDEASDTLEADRIRWEHGRDEAKAKLEALGVLDTIDWSKAFEEVRNEKDRLLQAQAEKDRSALAASLEEGLEKWLDSDDTLRALRDEYLNRRIERETTDEAKTVLERLRTMLDTRDGGARLSAQESRALDEAGLRTDGMTPDLMQTLDPDLRLETPRLELRPADVPVKRSFLDCLLFRDPKSVRESFFGPEGTEFIASARKRKRIAGKHLEALREMLASYPQRELPQAQRDYVNGALDAYTAQFRQALEAQREEIAEQCRQSLERCEAALRSNREMRNIFDNLAGANEAFAAAVDDLKERFGSELENSDEGAPALLNAGEAREERFASDEGSDETLAIDPETLEHAKERLKEARPEEQFER